MIECIVPIIGLVAMVISLPITWRVFNRFMMLDENHDFVPIFGKRKPDGHSSTRD